MNSKFSLILIAALCSLSLLTANTASAVTFAKAQNGVQKKKTHKHKKTHKPKKPAK